MKIDKRMARRFAEIRKAKGLTQEEFSGILKIDRSTISGLENGLASLTDKNINLVCLAFGVNETWLRTGVGEMLIDSAAPSTADEKKLITMFRRLVPEMQAIVLEKVRDMLKAIEESWTPPQTDEKGDGKRKRAAGD